jgi:hypothetical protein
MPRNVSRPVMGRPQAVDSAPVIVVKRVTSTELVRILRAEGFKVTPRIIDHAILRGRVPEPARHGGWRWFSESDAAAVRHYLRTTSRVQARTLSGGAE